ISTVEDGCKDEVRAIVVDLRNVRLGGARVRNRAHDVRVTGRVYGDAGQGVIAGVGGGEAVNRRAATSVVIELPNENVVIASRGPDVARHVGAIAAVVQRDRIASARDVPRELIAVPPELPRTGNIKLNREDVGLGTVNDERTCHGGLTGAVHGDPFA